MPLSALVAQCGVQAGPPQAPAGARAWVQAPIQLPWAPGVADCWAREASWSSCLVGHSFLALPQPQHQGLALGGDSLMTSAAGSVPQWAGLWVGGLCAGLDEEKWSRKRLFLGLDTQRWKVHNTTGLLPILQRFCEFLSIDKCLGFQRKQG